MAVLQLFVIVIVMRLNNMGGLDGGLHQLEILVHPRTAIAKRSDPEEHVLYLEKGVQVIGRFEPKAKNTARQQIDFFHHCDPVAFRISSLGRSTYTWALYRILANGSEEAEDSTGFNLRRTVELYQVELVEVVTRLAEELERTKSKKVRLEEIKVLWQRERARMKTNKAILKAIFPHQNVDLQFQVEIRNGLDLQIEEEQRQQEATMYNYQIRRPLEELDQLEQEREAQVEDNMQLVERGELYDTGSSKGNANNEVTLVLVHAAHVDEPDFEEEEEDELDVLEQPAPKQNLNAFMPNRKFSYLSDIIQRSHEGSSHYFSSSAGRQTSFKATEALPTTTETLEEDEQSQQSKLSKFNTLQQKFHHHPNPLKLAHDDFHRAVTSEKGQNIGDFGPQMSGISGASDVSGDLADMEGGTSGDPFAKWILFFALIVIGVVFFTEFDDIQFRRRRNKIPEHAKPL